MSVGLRKANGKDRGNGEALFDRHLEVPDEVYAKSESANVDEESHDLNNNPAMELQSCKSCHRSQQYCSSTYHYRGAI